LHATRDLRTTLAHVRGLLRHGGWLVLVEVTGAPGWLDLVFGMLEGWWRFADSDLREASALLPVERWRELLAKAGFDAVSAISDGDRQSLILARAGIIPGQRLLLGNPSFAAELAERLQAAGMPIEVAESIPAEGSWRETWILDDEKTPIAACRRLATLFADPRFGRLRLVEKPVADHAVLQAVRRGWALAAGLADPARWGGTLRGADLEQITQALLTDSNEELLNVSGSEPQGLRLRSLAAPNHGLPVRADATYLMTGGLGALGMRFVHWLVKRGARHLALVGRRPPSAEAASAIAALKAAGVQVWTFAANVADLDAMRQVMATLAEQAPPLTGIIHAAGTATDDPAEALAIKLDGASILDQVTAEATLELFLLFSSAAGVWGAKGKEAYAAANAALDAFAVERRSRGLPALSIAWGRFTERGLLSIAEDAALAEMGLEAMEPESAFDLAWRLTGDQRSHAVIAKVDWPRFRAVYEARGHRPLLDELPGIEIAPAPAVPRPAPLAGESGESVFDQVRRLVAETLGHADPETVAPDRGFFELGLDSLMAVRLRRRLEEALGRSIPAAALFSHPTVAALTDWLAPSAAPSASPETLAISSRVDASIAVIGIGCRFPGGVVDPDGFTRLLFEGRDAVTEIPLTRWDWREWFSENADTPGFMVSRWGGFLEDIDQFDAAFFNIPPKEAAYMDPQQRLLLEVAHEAVERAGLSRERLTGTRTGVFVGITSNDYAALARRGPPEHLEAQAITGQPSNTAAGRIAFALGLNGPAIALDTACSSSLVALHLAYQSLRSGECSLALAGGVNLVLAPETSVILSRAGMLSPTGRCRTFDAGADGFVRAEGCGVVILKPLSAALADGDPILAVVRGSAINHDGRASGFTVPNGRAQEQVIRAALADAGLKPAQIGYVEAHGTGTALGDPIEAHALEAALGENRTTPLYVGSVKTNIGHAESAAGIAGFIKTVLALTMEQIPANLHFDRLNPHIRLDGLPLVVPTSPTPWPAIDGRRIAGISSFGASGTNVNMIVEAPPLPVPLSELNRPTTPFRRKRYWLDWIDTRRQRDGAHDPSADWVYRIEWEGREGLSADPKSLLEQTPAGLLWWAGLDVQPDTIPALCEALKQFVESAEAPVWVITRGAVSIDPASSTHPAGAALWGLGRILALTHAEHWGGLIDLDPAADPAQDRAMLAAFLADPQGEDQVVLREIPPNPPFSKGGTVYQIYAPRLARWSAPLPESGPIRPDRTCLITGGLGGLGLALAGYLAETGARYLALIGRRPPGDEAAKIIAELESRGVTVAVFAADVADGGRMAEIAAHIEKNLPPVTHIFHAAGVKDGDFATVLRPKLAGAQVLHDLSRDWPVEEFVLFSSAAAVWGDRRLDAYAAANATLDGFAHWRRAQGLPALSINWGRFDVRGMLDAEGAALLDRMGLDPIPTNLAFATMRRLAATDRPQATVAAVRWPVFKPIYEGQRPRPLLARLGSTPAAASTAAPAVAEKSAEVGKLTFPLVLARLRERVAEILGVDHPEELDVERGFFALGLDSFGIVDLRRRLEAEFGVTLPASVLFEAPSIAALAARLAPGSAPSSLNLSPTIQSPPLTKGGEGGFWPQRPHEIPPSPPFPKGEDECLRHHIEPIAIVGLGLRLPGGVHDLASLESLLVAGIEAVGDQPEERRVGPLPADPTRRRGGFLTGIDCFDADFFGISPREAARIDPQHRLLLEVAWEALQHAGWSPPMLAGSRTGVFVGITGTEYATLAAHGGPDAHAVGGQFLNVAAGRISHTLGLTGPSLAVDTACSSSAMAVHLACQALRSGECDTALAGGVNLMLMPETTEMLIQARMLAADGRCKTFDAAADGYVRAEGCGLVVLKPLAQAEADGDRVFAVIRGTAANHDGASSGFTVPNGAAQEAVMRAALAQAGVDPTNVSYVEAHGTGTSLGDPVELHALDAVYGGGRARPLWVGSIKTLIGHAEAAAGIAGLLKLVASLHLEYIPPHLNFKRLNPHIQVSTERVTVAAEGALWEPIKGRRLAGLSAFGASGTNV
ncbi:MAG: SDR family NAD(P)-dependent oxidoreductase, partial [Candidatus Competibacteraceae bacterium]|nr:SDR family NAD(P)-dependent oxidoreductase [Candidatus Competibacteraceae bacterium]